jgi:hypothetical protein
LVMSSPERSAQQSSGSMARAHEGGEDDTDTTATPKAFHSITNARKFSRRYPSPLFSFADAAAAPNDCGMAMTYTATGCPKPARQLLLGPRGGSPADSPLRPRPSQRCLALPQGPPNDVWFQVVDNSCSAPLHERFAAVTDACMRDRGGAASSGAPHSSKVSTTSGSQHSRGCGTAKLAGKHMGSESNGTAGIRAGIHAGVDLEESGDEEHDAYCRSAPVGGASSSVWLHIGATGTHDASGHRPLRWHNGHDDLEESLEYRPGNGAGCSESFKGRRSFEGRRSSKGRRSSEGRRSSSPCGEGSSEDLEHLGSEDLDSCEDELEGGRGHGSLGFASTGGIPGGRPHASHGDDHEDLEYWPAGALDLASDIFLPFPPAAVPAFGPNKVF